MKTSQYIWFNGELKPWQDATCHVMAHGLHYGSSVFEGIRCYNTERGPAIFRLNDHIERMFESARIYRMPLGFDVGQIMQACRDVVRENALKSAYLRPIAYRGLSGFGLAAPPNSPIDIAIAAKRA